MNSQIETVQTRDHALAIECATTTAYLERNANGQLPPEQRLCVAHLRAELDVNDPPTFILNLPLAKSKRFPGCKLQTTTGIERRGAIAFARSSEGAIATDDRGIRNALGYQLDAEDVVKSAERQGRTIEAVTFFGNTTVNRGSLAFVEGTLSCNLADVDNIADGGRFSALVITMDGRAIIDDVAFTASADGWHVVGSQSGKLNARLAVSGQRLLHDGKPLDPYTNRDLATTYGDLRHLIVSGYASHIMDGGGVERRDFGLDDLLRDPEKMWQAVKGNAVRLELVGTDIAGKSWSVTPSALRAALHDKSYVEMKTGDEVRAASAGGRRGVYSVDESSGSVLIAYEKSPYPHHCVAIRAGAPAVLHEIVVGGWSNNAGVNPQSLARDLAAAGYTDACLFDNGGDCALLKRDLTTSWADPSQATAFVPSSLKRTKWAALLLYGKTKVQADYQFSR